VAYSGQCCIRCLWIWCWGEAPNFLRSPSDLDQYGTAGVDSLSFPFLFSLSLVFPSFLSLQRPIFFLLAIHANTHARTERDRERGRERERRHTIAAHFLYALSHAQKIFILKIIHSFSFSLFPPSSFSFYPSYYFNG